MAKLLLLAFAGLLSVSALSQTSVTITGVMDGTASGGKPKVIELYVEGTVDLSTYNLDRYNNGSTNATRLTLTGTYTNSYVYFTNGVPEFQTAFGSGGDFAQVVSQGGVNANGDDIYTLVTNGTIIDQVGGVIGQTPAQVLFQDSYLYRKSGTGPDGTWVADNWTMPGNDVLDNKSLAEQGAIVPFGTYRREALPVILTDFDLLAGTDEIELRWRTSYEIDFSHFSIQRLGAADRFTTLSTVEGRGPGDYHYVDRSPITGSNTYRLLLVDFDGTTEYSPLREATIAVGVTAGVKVVYGGRRAVRLLGLPEATTNYTLVAADGRTAASGTLTERTATVHYPAASRGVHYLTVYGDALGQTTFTLQPPR